MSKKQTAVEWLVEQIDIKNPNWLKEEIDQAKAMEKEQMIQSIIDTIVGSNKIYDKEYPEIRQVAEKYYTETYEQ